MPYKFKTSAKRSSLLRKIKSDKTTPELVLQKALRKKCIKFKKNYNKLPGMPDIVLLENKVAIFVDGEFWHGYRWQDKKKTIKCNRRYWIPKIEKTILRDKGTNAKLRKEGWTVIRFWQHQIIRDLPKCLYKITKAMEKNSK